MISTRLPASARSLVAAASALKVLALCIFAAAPARADGLAELKTRGVLLWGGDVQGGEPYVYEDATGKLVGFEVDIADAIARRLGVRARFVQVAWSNLVPALERGDFDMAMNGLELTADRHERLLLTRPYYLYAETLAVRRGSPLRFFDLRGKRVGTLNQTYAYDLLRGLGGEPILYEGTLEPYQDLVNGRLDAVLMDNIIADRYGCPKPEVECIVGDGAIGAYVIGVRKGDTALHRAIDDALADMQKTGELRAILERHKLWDARQEGARPPLTAEAPPARRKFDVLQGWLFLQGAGVTLILSVLSFLLAMVLGGGMAVARVYGPKPVRALASAYVEIFRGTPVLLQLYVLYFALAPIFRLDGLKWRPRIQTYDAPFSLEKADSFTLHMPNGQPSYIRGQDAVPVFDDRRSYWDAQQPNVGVKVPNAGVRIAVQSASGTSMRIKISSTQPAN